MHNIGEEFKEFLSKQTDIINNLISSNFSNYIYTTNIIQIKIDIYNFLQNKILIILSELNQSSVTEPNKPDNAEKINILIQILNDINNLIKEKEISLYKIIEILHSKDSKSKRTDSKPKDENENLLKENLHLKSEIIEKNKLNKILENDNKLLNEKYEKIKLENDALTSKLLEKSKNLLKDEDYGKNDLENNNRLNDISKNQTMNNKTNLNNTLNNRINLPNVSLNSLNQQIIISKRKLTKDQINDFIQNIYKSKALYDQNCVELNKPLETMEQHMYQYLNQKFGLKSLTIEYASAIINGIKEFSKKDMNIKLFGMLLKNEVEENTLTIVEKIKQVVQETLEYFISQKNQYKSTKEISKIAEKMKKGLLDEDIWNAIVNTLFLNDQENGIKVKEKIYEFSNKVMKKSMDEIGQKLNFEMTREEKDFYDDFKNYQKKIRYEDLLNILIDYHIKVRKNYLKNMRTLFMKNDSNKDGVLTKKEFIQYISELKIFHEETLEENIDYLLRKMPQCEKYNFFSFSEVVDLFDQEQILKENNERSSILDFLAK